MAALEARLAGTSPAQATSDKPEGGKEEVETPVAESSWPSENDEAAFLAEQRAQGGVAPASVAAVAAEETEEAALPSLDELVQRIPAEAREAMDDLFRAKFIAVRRVSKKTLKT